MSRDPDTPPTDEELRQAEALAEALDAPEPPSLEGELGDLLATAGMIGAVAEARPLARERRDALLDEVLATSDEAGARPAPLRRVAPWLALAASVLLVAGVALTQLPRPDSPVARRSISAAAAAAWTLSRPSNDLLGRPIKDRAGAARRLDRVFADRLAGYRHLTLARADTGQGLAPGSGAR